MRRLDYLQQAANNVTYADRVTRHDYEKDEARYSLAMAVRSSSAYKGVDPSELIPGVPMEAPEPYEGRPVGEVPPEFQEEMLSIGFTTEEIQAAINVADEPRNFYE